MEASMFPLNFYEFNTKFGKLCTNRNETNKLILYFIPTSTLNAKYILILL